MTETQSPIAILLVEDNEDDILLMRRALSSKASSQLRHVARDGQAALDYLVGLSAGDLPELVLLDLNLPRKNGLEVLAEIRALPRLRRLAVVVLSSSERREDIDATYDRGGNSFLTKPVEFRAFTELVAKIDRYWSSNRFSAAEPA